MVTVFYENVIASLQHITQNIYGIRSGYSPCGRFNKSLFTRLLTRNFSDVEKAFVFLFSDLGPIIAKSGNEKAFQRQRRLGLPGCLVDMKLTSTIALQSTYYCLINKWYLHGCRVNCPLSTRLLGEQMLIYPAAG